MNAAIRIKEARWPEDCAHIKMVRHEVFVQEQGVAETLEWDGLDAGCRHVLAWDNGAPIATGRLLPSGQIGRMAVRKQWRGRGIGGKILRVLLAIAAQNPAQRPWLSAQTHAIDFYRRHGFVCISGEYMEAGIPHRKMRLSMPSAAAGEGEGEG